MNKLNYKKILSYILLLFLFSSITHCEMIKRKMIDILASSEKYKPEGDNSKLSASFNGKDLEREKIKIKLTEIAGGYSQPTDLQFPPGEDDTFLITEKKGNLKWGRVGKKDSGTLIQIPVLVSAEEGLLGLAFHPEFAENGKIYLNFTTQKDGKDFSRVSEWILSKPKDIPNSQIGSEKILMEVAQPYANHNAGQLAFGSDSYLYIGWGDGGLKDDSLLHGQNPETFLGSMLRIDVNSMEGSKPYKIPDDNPFLGKKGFAPEVFAYGFRNPWRYSFSNDGRMIVSDVGQELWEEIDIIEKGKNYGWNTKEASHCFMPKENCNTESLTDPIYEYGREDGQSITGGYVYSGKGIKELSNKYVFGDFITGRIWAFDLPSSSDKKVTTVYSLGKWAILISTFGKDSSGNIYVVDFGSGRVFRIDSE